MAMKRSRLGDMAEILLQPVARVQTEFTFGRR